MLACINEFDIIRVKNFFVFKYLLNFYVLLVKCRFVLIYILILFIYLCLVSISPVTRLRQIAQNDTSGLPGSKHKSQRWRSKVRWL